MNTAMVPQGFAALPRRQESDAGADAVAATEVQQAKQCVGVVEDDAAVRRALCLMLEGLNMDVHPYASAREFLEDPHGQECCACLVLDVRLPGMSGIELQKQLKQGNRSPAIVFITGHAEVPMAVEAMRNGAVDFLQKPFKEQQLVDSVQKALAAARRWRQSADRSELVAARLASLTSREREVFAGLMRGLRNKQVAAELGVSTKTAEEHRSNIMRKMQVASVGEMIALCGGTS